MSSLKLEHKILVIIVIALVCGLGLSVVITIERESANLRSQKIRESRLFAETLMAGFRNVMLAGRAGYVKQLVADARNQFTDGHVRLFNNSGEEIFSERGQFLSNKTDLPEVVGALASHKTQTFGSVRVSPLFNEERCQSCHGSNHEVRGATWLSLRTEEGSHSIGLMVGRVLAAAFKQIMISGQGELADSLLMDVASIPGVRFAQVYDNTGTFPAFGDLDDELDEIALERAVSRFDEDPHGPPQSSGSAGHGELFFLPLPNEERCYVCHGDDHQLRGVLALSFSEQERAGSQSAEEQLPVVQESFDTGFRSMMLVESGSHSGQFVHAVRQLPFVDEARIFTESKSELIEVYVPNENRMPVPQSVLDSIQTVIRSVNVGHQSSAIEPVIFTEDREGEPFLVQLIPIVNDQRCQACHQPPEEGSPDYAANKDRWRVRTVVEVASSMAAIQDEIKRNQRTTVIVGLITLVFVWIILRFFMKRFIIRPIGLIGGAADQIGGGNLRARVDVGSEDELGSLAGQINEMATGLRERFELTKFVSGETLGAVQGADEGVQLGGERKVRTLFFSDIRGFTAYSEGVEPEEVIRMLNTYLRAQTEIVNRWGGDIDKFVGDELVATFDDEGDHAEGMVARAAGCAYEIQQRIEELNKEYPDAAIGVGIGINTGQVVLGAMGSEARMDYTVLGDNVNVAARLCSAADAHQIIISEASYDQIRDRNDIQVRPLPPLSVKNKSEPLTVFEIVGVEIPPTTPAE